MSISQESKQILCKFFQLISELEAGVEKKRQELANCFDFEPYAAFCRLDSDDDAEIYMMDFYNFLRDNDIKQFTYKDIQLMCTFYDLDNNGSLEYEEFMKFILPCNNK